MTDLAFAVLDITPEPFAAAPNLFARLRITESSGEPARLTAPPSGLFLERVYYRGDARQTPLVPATPIRAL